MKKRNILIGIIIIAIVILLIMILGNKKEYNVSFDSVGGTMISNIVVKEDGTIEKPADPQKEGYKFAGWYYNGELFDFSMPITSDIKLEAKWTELQPVSGVKLDRTEVTLGIGSKTKLVATITPADVKDNSLTWTSSNTEVATVDAEGNVTALKAGKATITVKTNDGGFTATATVVVTKDAVNVTGIELNKTSLTLNANESATLTAKVEPSDATNKKVTWSSSDTSVATVTNGKVTGKKAGKVTITVTTEDGKFTAKCEVTVKEVKVTGVELSKTSLNLNVGKSATLTATVKPTDATNKKVTWKSSNTSVATVDKNGKVTAKAEGTTTITVTTEDGKFTAKCEVKVSEVKVTGVTLSKTSATLEVGKTLTLTATVKPSDATNKKVTWTSSDTSVATVTNGKVTTKKAGTTTITVTTEDGKYTAKCVITVKEKPASYAMTLKIHKDLEGNVSQLEVISITKNGSAFGDYKGLKYNGKSCIKSTKMTFDGSAYKSTLKEATIVLSNGETVKAVVSYS